MVTPALEDLPSTFLPEASGADRPESVFLLIEKLFPGATKLAIFPCSARSGWVQRDLQTESRTEA